MKSLSTAFMPKFLKEVVTHIPTLALKSMDWKGAIKELGPLVARVGKKSLEEDCFESLQRLEIKNLALTHNSCENNYESLSTEDRVEAGESVLRLYFTQLRNSKGLCLDLRPRHFEYRNNTLVFSPNNVWLAFSEDFRVGLLNLYKGFYFDNDELFETALKSIGLTKNLSPKEDEELKELFRKHFGPGDQEEVVFSLEHFKESFYELFKVFMDHEVALDKDFMFLGVYLVGLYMNLESLNVPLNVREIFLDVFSE